MEDTDHSTPVQTDATGEPATPNAAAPRSGQKSAEPSVSQTSEKLGDSSLALMDSGDAAVWYVRPPAGGQYGPADRETLLQWINQGRVASTALLWRDGWPQWRVAEEALPEMSAQLAAAMPPPSGDAPNGASTSGSSGQSPSPSAPRPGMNNPVLTGDAAIGVARARMSRQRITVVATLTAVLLGLIAVLVFVLLR